MGKIERVYVMLELRDDVIEAARELHAARSGQGNFADAKYMDAINRFSLAIEALERAEGKTK